MKKVFAILTIILCFGVTAAFAVDGGEVYQKRCAKCVVLKGQSAQEIEMKLTGYVDGTYGGAKKKVMERMAKGLSGDELKAVSAYIGSL
jgi:cytochrome c